MSGRSPENYRPPVDASYDAGQFRDIKDHCAVAGVIGPDIADASHTTYLMIDKLQHRGQESAGIAFTPQNGQSTEVMGGMGLVKTVFDEGEKARNPGSRAAIGHDRYGTSSVGSAEHHIQPVYDRYLALSHNGNFPTTDRLDEFLNRYDVPISHRNDTERFHAAMSERMRRGASLEEAMAHVLPMADGAASLLAMNKDVLVAARKKEGIRPLAMGRLGENVVFASETVGLPEGAEFIREVRPGEMIVADRRGISGIQSFQVEEGVEKLDLFEVIYFSSPQSELYGKKVADMRAALGAELYREAPTDADIVIPVPDSAIPAAKAYAEAAGIEYVEDGIIKDKSVKRTFIEPDPVKRREMVKKKLQPNAEKIRGKRVTVIDDSIVRRTTSEVVIESLWEAGAAEVHMGIHSPPIRFPELHGVDLRRQTDLVAHRRSVEQIRQIIGATSLSFLSFEGTIKALGIPAEKFATGPFTGTYPTEIGKIRDEIDFNQYDYYPALTASK
jgi:amidophosphoribosyltransferase